MCDACAGIQRNWRKAPGHAELVQRVAELCGEYGRHAASAAEARAILGLA